MFSGITTVAVDHGGTLTVDGDDRQQAGPLDPEAAKAIRTLHERKFRILLASNTQEWEVGFRHHRLMDAGIRHCFAQLIISTAVGYAKPEPEFYTAVLDAAKCEPHQVLFVGNRAAPDVFGPRAAGMHAALVAPQRPPGVLHHVPVVGHFRDIPGLLA